MLRIEELVSGYGPIRVLEGISISVGAGQIVTVIGANGAGKSTLVNTISGMLSVHSGRIIFDGVEITRSAPEAIVGHGVVQVPEGRKLFGALTVNENLLLGSHRIRADRRKRDERMDFVLQLFPRLKERAQQAAGTLSGGEQQMVTLGRALMADPRLILLDEPTLGLAPRVVDEMFAALEKLRKLGTTLLLIEQRAEAALNLADVAYVMANGRIILEGPASVVRSSDDVRSAYLGGAART